jgi:hypothetical protein
MKHHRRAEHKWLGLDFAFKSGTGIEEYDNHRGFLLACELFSLSI